MSCQRARQVDLGAFLVDADAAEWDEFRGHYPACRDCAREVERWTRFETGLRAAGAGTTGAHPAEDDLLAFEENPNWLSPEQRTSIAAHVEGCRLCRNELAVLGRFDFSRIQVPLPAERGPAVWTRLVTALREAGERTFAALPQPVLALALLAVLMIPAGLYLWRTHPGAPVAEAPQLAHVETPKTPPAALPRKSPVEPASEPEAEVQIAAREAAPPSGAPRAAEAAVPKPEVAAEPAPAAQVAAHEPPVAPPEPRPEAPPAVPAPEPMLIAALLPSEMPLYTADPALVGTASLRITGYVRGAEPGAAGVQVAAPEHIGLTQRASPTLYWYLSERTALPVEISVSVPGAAEPVLDVSLPGPLASGFHSLDLAQRGVKLAAGVDYRWYVSLVVDPDRRSRDVVSGGAIRRVPAKPLESTPEAQRANAYAEAGLWYDAFDQLSRWIAREPRAARLHTHRAALLDQVGLRGLAQFDRRLGVE